MGNSLIGMHLGSFGIDLDILLFPHPRYLLHTGKEQAQRVWYQCPSLAYIINTPDGRILFDTGSSPRWAAEWSEDLTWLMDMRDITPDLLLEHQLKLIGLGPEDFRYVVQGHLHADHAGGLRLFEQAGAQILLHEDEFRNVERIEVSENGFVRHDWHFLTQQRQPTLVYGDQELARDVRLVSLPGHTPGSMGLLVRLEHTGWVLLPGDALATHESYGPPAVTNRGWDINVSVRSIEKLRGIAIETGALIFPGHDTTAVQQHRHDHDLGEHTEFQPIKFQQFNPGFVYE